MREPRSHPAEPDLPDVDQATAELLLDGRGERLAPGPATPAYAAVRAVFEAARGPATAAELGAQDAIVAAFRAQHRHRRPSRRPRVLAKLLTLKAAVAAVGTVSIVSVAAAAANHLPDSGAPAGAGAGTSVGRAGSAPAGELDRVASVALCEAAARPAGTAEQRPAADALARLAGGPDKVAAYCANAVGTRTRPPSPSGPDAAGTAGLGLCRAYQAGKGVEKGGKATAVAFEALARVAGGRDRIAAYCRARLAAADAHQPSNGQPAATPTRHAPSATPSHPGTPATDHPNHPAHPTHPATPSHPGPGGTPTP